MIKSLKLTNFMKHEALSVEFGEGLQILKGANESGKSSILLGIAYAFFGAKALRDTFSESVTHGKPDATLKVELVLNLAGRSLTVTRGKSGAEVLEGGKPIVTGQVEVTNFLSGLIGADASAAGKLMLASQGNLRGSLENGPKATAEMIESLADFDLFERLIEAMQTRLMLGNTDVVAAQVEAAQATLAGMTEPAAPDMAAFDRRLAGQAKTLGDAKAESDRLFTLDDAAGAALQALQTRANNKANLELQLADEHHKHTELVGQHSALIVAAVCAVTPGDIQAKRDEITAARDYAAVAKAFSEFGALGYPAEFWEGAAEEFDTEWAGAKANLTAINRAIADHRSEIKVMEKSKVTSSICGFCGKDFTSLPEIAAKNSKFDADIEAARVLISLAESRLHELQLDLAGYEAVAKAAKPITDAALRLEKYITADLGFYPPRLAWAGPALSAAPAVLTLTSELKALEDAVRDAAAAGAKAEIVAASIVASETSARALQERMSGMNDCTAAALAECEAAKIAAHKTWSDTYGLYSQAAIDLSTLQREKDDTVRMYRDSKRAWDGAVDTLTEKRAMLEDMIFNNSLLKKVRMARPVIADKLWSLVLASVSSMFSRMRGEASVVTKSKDGFSVNGHAVQTLSGSTLDLLGLALRVALTRTFIPHSPFLILDEPFSACDVDRSVAMLGFIKSSGFTQTILVTHDEISETVADNLVEL